MSDDISPSYSNREGTKLFFGDRDIRESLQSRQLKWMAHWTQTSSNSSLQCHKHYTVVSALESQVGHCYSSPETMKPIRMVKCQNLSGHDLKECDPSSYMLQSAEIRAGGDERFRLISNSAAISDNLNTLGPETLDKLHKHKSVASSVNWENFASCHFQHSKSLVSEGVLFPTFGITRKMEKIMAPKKMTSHNSMLDMMSDEPIALAEPQLADLSPHLIGFTSRRHEQHDRNIMQNDEDMRESRSGVGVPHYSPHRPNMSTSMQINKEKDLFCPGVALKEDSANANFINLKHDFCRPTKYSNNTASKMEKENLMCSKSSWARLKDGPSSYPGGDPHTYLAECRKEIRNVCGRDNSTEADRTSSSSAIGAREREAQNLSDANQNLLVTNYMNTDLCHKGQTVGAPAASTKVKETAFFEKLTLSSMSYLHNQQKNIQTLASSAKSQAGVDGIAPQSMEKEKEPFGEPDTMHIGVPRSPEDEAGSSSGSQKMLPDVEHHVMDIPGAENFDAYMAETTDILPQKHGNTPTETTENDSEPSWKWVKRLRSNPLDPLPPSTKRFKIGDTSSGEMQNLLVKVVNYNRSISELPERLQLSKTALQNNGDCFQGDPAKLTPWIRRWCRPSQVKSLPSPVLYKPETAKMQPEKLEAKQIPSLAAMALMGKQVTNFRPCEFRKRGATVIWNV